MVCGGVVDLKLKDLRIRADYACLIRSVSSMARVTCENIYVQREGDIAEDVDLSAV